MFSKITISGKICVGKSSTFRELQKKLNWPTFSTGQYFREYAKEHNLVLDKAEEQSDTLTKKIDGMVKDKLNQSGHLLLDAWLGGILADDNTDVLKVLLIADDDVRFARFAKREGLTPEEAKKEVLQRDSAWFQKVSKIHNRSDFFDEKNYNLVIDTSHLTVEEITSLILKSLSQ